LFRQGIKKIIKDKDRLAVIGEASDGLELLHLLEKLTPDLIIIDVSMPRFRRLEALQIIKKE
jgi:DNA-binding NarL/FixJ family response regulator